MPSSAVQLAVIVPVSLIALDLIRRHVQITHERKGVPLPPGPAPIPLLGNAHSVDLEEPWKTYTDWHAKYGNVLYLRLLDEDFIVLGAQRDAVELLEKRSQLYSDCPFIPVIKPFGGEFNFSFTPYGDHWRIGRRIFHQTFRSEAALNFRPMQLRCARQLVMNMANHPDRYVAHYSTFAVTVALSAAYDYEPRPQNDPMVHIIEASTAAGVAAITPLNAILFKLFPFLLYIPDWLPGSSLKREANRSLELATKSAEVPYQYAERRMKTAHECPTFSMVSDHLSRMDEQDESQRTEYATALKKAAVSSILGAEETMSTSLMVFTLAMVLHPHAWKRAQAEIDLVVGNDRLPDFDDRSALPYVDAIIRETLRWHPALPLGVWHATSSSDIYNGYYIPKGATIVANAWAISRDQDRFPNPEAFIPERYLDEDGILNDNDPTDFVFGFGRRICPGRHTADATLWSAISTMLATLEFHPARCKGVTFEPKWLNGLTHRPDVFPCRIALRAHVDKTNLERMLVD